MRSHERERTNVTALHPGRTGPPDGGRIGIVGDHRLVVESLQAALRAQGFVVDAVDARGAGPHEIVRAAVAGRPGVVLLDLDLRLSTDSTDLIAPLRASGTRVLAITSSHDSADHDLAVSLGAVAVLPKTTARTDLLAAVRRATAGLDVMSPDERRACFRRNALVGPARSRELQGLGLLSPREAEILAALVEGHSVGEISTSSYVQPSTVRAQVRSILLKLGVSSQLQAVALAHRRSWRLPRAG